MSTPISNYLEQGLAYLDSGEYDAAISSLTKALRLSLGDLAEILVYRGEAYAIKGDAVRAMADFNEALRQNPTSAAAYCARAALRRYKADERGAIQDAGYALQLDPTYIDAYYNRALAHETLGDLISAERDLTDLLALDAELISVYELRGRIRARLNDYDGAVRDLQHYLRQGGGHEYDNHSETQSFLLSLQVSRFFARFLRLGRRAPG